MSNQETKVLELFKQFTVEWSKLEEDGKVVQGCTRFLDENKANCGKPEGHLVVILEAYNQR